METLTAAEEHVNLCVSRCAALRKRRVFLDYVVMCGVTAACLLSDRFAVAPTHHITFAGLYASVLITKRLTSSRAAQIPAIMAAGYALYSLLAAGQLDKIGEWVWFGLIIASAIATVF